MTLLACITIGICLLDAGDGARAVNYSSDIKPVLRERCFACHGPLKQEGNLRLDTVAAMKRGGDSGPAVRSEPGEAAKSSLLARVRHVDPALRMPADGPPLTARQIADLERWIANQAPAPVDEKPERDPRDHWAFKAPVRPPLPQVADAEWNRNPIDRFIAAEHESRGLKAAALADQTTLLRRVYLDLTGLPPTAAQCNDFLGDASPTAYEKVVDSLLASPHYGERWARHWMDVWRYSDWYGRRSVPDNLNSYGQIWRWRDWIVRSLNADRGYDRMVVEMLAGDEVCPTDADNVVATGFLLRNFYRWNYNQWMRDNVEHTAKAFLGLTMNCCQCHDHKYDPLTQVDYFRLRAVFEPLQVRHYRSPGEPDPGPFEKYVYAKSYKPIESGAAGVYDEVVDAKTHLYLGGDERSKDPNRAPIPPGAPTAFAASFGPIRPIALPPAAWYPGFSEAIRNEEIAKTQAAIATARRLQGGAALAWVVAMQLKIGQRGLLALRAWTTDSAYRTRSKDILERPRLEWQLAVARLVSAQSDIASLAARMAADDVAMGAKVGHREQSAASAAAAEARSRRDAAALDLAAARRDFAMASGNPKDAKKLGGIEAKLKTAQANLETANKAIAAPGRTYAPLSQTFPKFSSGRRTALAKWIVQRDNPLTARVAVNHFWGWHFGRPIVETTENFGVSGKPPTHANLLDWLALELVERNWKWKDLHRLIVTSRTYRMRSLAGTSSNRSIDPDNRYLWQFPLQRMEAEVVRDSILHAAGQLDATMGGKELPHEKGLESRRRSLYFAHHGESSMQLLELFDAPNACDAYRRTSSILPQQALALVNAEFVRVQSRALAASIDKSRSAIADDRAFVAEAFQRVLGRRPRDNEMAASIRFLTRRRQETVDSNQAKQPPNSTPTGERTDFVQALFNHHDFVTIR